LGPFDGSHLTTGGAHPAALAVTIRTMLTRAAEPAVC
jgi:hypothetical protein